MRAPSGDQAGSRSMLAAATALPLLRSAATCFGCLPSGVIVQMRSKFETAMRLPSGDQAGSCTPVSSLCAWLEIWNTATAERSTAAGRSRRISFRGRKFLADLKVRATCQEFGPNQTYQTYQPHQTDRSSRPRCVRVHGVDDVTGRNAVCVY